MNKIKKQVYERVLNANTLGVFCEKCGSDSVTEISYGLPAWIIVDEPMDSGIEKLIEERKIVLGGCSYDDDSPKYFCRACGNKFGKYIAKWTP